MEIEQWEDKKNRGVVEFSGVARDGGGIAREANKMPDVITYRMEKSNHLNLQGANQKEKTRKKSQVALEFRSSHLD